MTNCIAPSIASLIVGLVVGAISICGLVGVVTLAIHEHLTTDELKRLRKIAKAAWALYEDEHVEGFVASDASDNAPAEVYEMPALVWENFEKALEESDAKYEETK